MSDLTYTTRDRYGSFGLTAIWPAAGIIVLLVAALAPLFVVTVPPLHDYPFHLARADILASLPNSAFLRQHYQIGSFVLPNVGMDLVMLGLIQKLPVLVAGRVLVGLTLLTILTGTVALHAALHRRFSAWPLLAAFFLYNWILSYGFLNYLLGVGLMLWAAAIWAALRERGALLRVTVASVSALALLFCHLMALGLFALVIGGMELQRAAVSWRAERWNVLRDLALAAVPFAIALLVFVLVSPAAGEAQHSVAYHGGLGWKPLAAYRSLLTPIGGLDGLTLLPVLLGVAVALWRRRLRLAFPMTLPLALLVATFIAMPFYIFGGEVADARLPVAILFVAIAATGVVGVGRHAIGLCIVAALALLSLRSAVIARDWIGDDTRIAAFTDAFRRLPDGATLYAASAGRYPSIDYRDDAGLALWNPPLKHVVSLASIGRKVFVPATWSNPFQQPIQVQERLAPVKEFQGSNPLQTPSESQLNEVVREIAALRPLLSGKAGSSAPPDYLLLLYPGSFRGRLPAGAVTVAGDTDFVLLRLPAGHDQSDASQARSTDRVTNEATVETRMMPEMEARSRP